ncbi:MAG TPA: ABC transporter substrate binding protein, partial [Candidatus Nanoarchaeia archaeon]|nr:ABC transporter substrate binding protein [Candidatus Nanoarchaeia archaeon]
MKSKLCFLASLLILLGGCDMYTIGISPWGPLDVYEESIEGFKEGLALNGFIEGENVEFIVRSAEFDLEKQIDIADEFVREDVDLIYSITAQGTLILKATIKDKPIVFNAIFPVETGIIDSFGQSGNNCVGIAANSPVNNQYDYFYQLLPDMKSIAFLHYEGEPNSEIQKNEFLLFFAQKGITVHDV